MDSSSSKKKRKVKKVRKAASSNTAEDPGTPIVITAELRNSPSTSVTSTEPSVKPKGSRGCVPANALPYVPSERQPGFQESMLSKVTQLYCVPSNPDVRVSLPVYSRDEVSEHNSSDDCWLIVDDYVYDVTEFIRIHKGGTTSIEKCAGTDASYHVQFHSSEMMRLLKRYYLVGRLDSASSCTIS